MSKLDLYYSTIKSYEEVSARLKKLESDPELKKALEFRDKLQKLMAEYNKDVNDVFHILGINPDQAKSSVKSSGKKGAQRREKTYRNPHTGEVVTTRGGNHKVLNAWRQQYGKEQVDSWLQS